MNNKKLGIVAAVLVLALGAWLLIGGSHAPAPVVVAPVTVTPSATTTDYKSATYIIEGKPVTLVNGSADSADVLSSSTKTTTQYFGNDATGDLDGDGVPDVAFILTQSAGGSGVFYYVVAALKTPDGYKGTNAILLGDRIAPQTTAIQNGVLVVNFADRKPTEPMTAEPSVGVSKKFKVSSSTLVVVK